jgi:SAM-dependent methyltransferase
MSEYGAETYGDRWAEIYDQWVARFAQLTDAEQVADVLAAQAGSGPALELAIGTGRVALPLASRGLEVHGVDISEAMVGRLRSKPGGDLIPVTMGNFADVPVEGRYALIYIVFNTLFALLSQEEQVRCFQNVAAHLTEGGAFVIEAFVPDVSRYVRGQNVEATVVETELVGVTFSRHDPTSQRVTSVAMTIEDGRILQRPVQIRYAWPSELDLMARLAGLRLRERWGSWDGEPFSSSSGSHISIYERPPSEGDPRFDAESVLS